MEYYSNEEEAEEGEERRQTVKTAAQLDLVVPQNGYGSWSPPLYVCMCQTKSLESLVANMPFLLF